MTLPEGGYVGSYTHSGRTNLKSLDGILCSPVEPTWFNGLKNALRELPVGSHVICTSHPLDRIDVFNRYFVF